MASSIPHHHHHLFSNEFCNFPIGQEVSDVVPLLNYDINSPPSSSFPDNQQLGVAADCMVVPQMSDIVTGFRDFTVSDYQHHQVFEPGEDYSLPNFYQTYNSMPPHDHENWGIQAVTKVEETEVKVGRYSVEEKKERILRYLKKRSHRNFNKTIKYACRKTLADKRVRVRGRFAKNNEPSDHDRACQQNNYSYSFQMKCEEDYWLQAAIDNLVHLPYLAS